MKIKILIVLVVLALAAFFVFSVHYENLDPQNVMVVPNDAGSPTLVLSDGVYFVRDWNVQPGCYRMTKIGIINFNFASPAESHFCQSSF